MGSAATPAEKYFQGKYLKHEQQGSGVEISGKVRSVGFVHMLALKSGGPLLSFLARGARPGRTSADGFITEAFSLSPSGPAPVSSWWEHGKEHRVPSPGEVLACGTKKATVPEHTTQVHVRSCWS